MRNKKIVLIILSTVLLLVGVFFVVGNGEDPLANKSTVEPSTTSRQDTSTTDKPKIAAQDLNPNGYQEYDAQTVSQTDGQKILFFHAGWCPTCKALDQNIKDNGIPNDLTVFKINFDVEKELRQRYGVTIPATLVQIDDNGNPIKDWYGSVTVQQLLEQVI